MFVSADRCGIASITAWRHGREVETGTLRRRDMRVVEQLLPVAPGVEPNWLGRADQQGDRRFFSAALAKCHVQQRQRRGGCAGHDAPVRGRRHMCFPPRLMGWHQHEFGQIECVPSSMPTRRRNARFRATD